MRKRPFNPAKIFLNPFEKIAGLRIRQGGGGWGTPLKKRSATRIKFLKDHGNGTTVRRLASTTRLSVSNERRIRNFLELRQALSLNNFAVNFYSIMRTFFTPDSHQSLSAPRFRLLRAFSRVALASSRVALSTSSPKIDASFTIFPSGPMIRL